MADSGFEDAQVSESKVRDYLLNPLHPRGCAKATFFLALGYRTDCWHVLARDLRRLLDHCEPVLVDRSPHGLKYLAQGILTGPAGLSAPVRTVWIVDRNQARPRLVTAYPGAAG